MSEKIYDDIFKKTLFFTNNYKISDLNLNIENSEFKYEDGIYKLTVIVNKDYGDGELIITPEDVINDVKDEIQRRNYRIYKWNVKIFRSEESIEIPEDYVDQYFANSYFDIEGINI